MTAKKAKSPLYLASKNRHKLDELQAMIGTDLWELRLASDLNPSISWEETGTTFEANATIKAEVVRQYTNAAVLADDSGLIVDALDGAPGVYSSRYAGRDGDDKANNEKLLYELQNTPTGQRAARFVCCLVFIDHTGKSHTVEGFCEGRIALAPRGLDGFGYDPLFELKDSSKTMAELTSAEKNSISHRSVAVKKWLVQFGSYPVLS